MSFKQEHENICRVIKFKAMTKHHERANSINPNRVENKREKKKAAVKSLLRTKVKKHNNILLKEGRNTVRQKIRTRFFFSPEIDG